MSGNDPENTSTTAKAKFGFFASLQLVKENFAVVSAAAILVGVTLATIFLASYLSVFDWHLVWYVQYPDILSFGLVAIALFGVFFTLLQGIAATILASDKTKPSSYWTGLGVLAAFGMVFLALDLWSEHRKLVSHYESLAWGWAVLFMIVAVIAMLGLHFRNAQWPTLAQMVSIASVVVILTVGVGKWLAFSVRDSSTLMQDINVRGTKFQGARLIVVLSRHTIFLKDNTIHIVRTADITEFETHVQGN